MSLVSKLQQATQGLMPAGAALPKAESLTRAKTPQDRLALHHVTRLATGASGDEVRELQVALRKLGLFNYPTDTAYYGSGTASAVTAFQTEHGLTATGRVDEPTWEAIRAAVKAQPAAAVHDVSSELVVDARIQPRAHSIIPGYQNEVEQCGEFTARYFQSQGKDYPTLGQPHSFFTTGKDHLGRTRPQFERLQNGGAEPPSAGDLLVAKGPRPGQFHTAVITKVSDKHVHVLQSNMPLNWKSGKEVHGVYPLEIENGLYRMPPLPTRSKGYTDDYAVVGWIRPTGDDALPKK